jgi:hypothetical protein
MLNYEKRGIPIALVKNNNELNHKDNQIIYFCDNPDETKIKHPYETIDTDSPNEKIQYIPNVQTERSVIYICGRSGCGKSYYSKEYIECYHMIFPKNPVYVFSYLDKDPTLDSMEYIKRVKIFEDGFLDAEFEISDFDKSLVLFDDCDCIKDKKLRKKIDSIMAKVLQVGRHHNVSCLCLSHQICNGSETKLQLNESNSIVLFPKGMGVRTLNYVLENYIGMSRKQVMTVKKLKSRSVTIIKSSPMVIVSDKKIYVLKDPDEDDHTSTT